MHDRTAILGATAVFLICGLLLAAPTSHGQTGDIQDILDDLEGSAIR